MTRRIKTWRSTSELIEALRNWSFDPFRVRYRRQPKGHRAKSGQWAKRTPCPVRLGAVVEQTIKAMPALLDMAERCAKAEADLIALRALDGDKGAT